MRDLWAFLIVTLTVSGVAAVILLVKWLLKDKLSPRWQFSAWLVVLLTALIPVGKKYILIDWPMAVETFKSELIGDYTLTKMTASVPMLPESVPVTAADWLFVIYLAGAALLFLHYLISYIRLRILLRKGREVPVEMQEKIKNTKEKYGLSCCRAVIVPGLSSAFVCGLIHPILAMPADRDTDEKVLLHEMLHLKYRDVIWGWVICLLRCIHWCNPFLWYCANRAGNDLESLCDQRVLERLEGEQRREYGRILLSMANEKYARAPGTSSAANGGKNIRQRIEAIARFKRYPRGMALVSVCILIVLASPAVYGSQNRSFEYHGAVEMESALAAARLTDCTTFAGAADCYGKAVLTGEGIDRILCADDREREQIAKEMVSAVKKGNDSRWNCGITDALDPTEGYYIYNVREKNPDCYQALLVFKSAAPAKSEENMIIVVQNISVRKEGGRWIAEPLDTFRSMEVMETKLNWNCRELPAHRLVAEAEDFQLALNFQKNYEADNRVESPSGNLIFPSSVRFNLQPNPNAEFTTVHDSNWATLTYVGDHKNDIRQVGISYAPWPEGHQRPDLDAPEAASGGGSSNRGFCWSSETVTEWKNPVIDLGGGGYSGPFDNSWLAVPERYAADLYINGELAAQLTVLPEEGIK